MKFLIILLVSSLLAAPAHAQRMDSKFESIVQMYEDEEKGLRHYDSGDYAKAFGFLSETAIRGLKKSQYILAFMFLKGEHVNKSILLGMGWLGVAKESGDEEWIKLYDGLYARAAPAQQAMIDNKVAQYVNQYGVKAMNVSCTQAPVTGSRRPEYRCLKTEGPAFDIYPVEMQP